MTPPFRIGVDGRAFASPAGGVRRYVSELYSALAGLAPEVEVVAIGAAPETPLPPRTARRAAMAFPTNLGWTALSLPLAARGAGLSVFHAPAYTAPLWGAHPSVVTIHDVSYERKPEWNAYRNDRVRRAFYRRGALAADRVLTDSSFSRDEIVAAYGIAAERISVVPLAAAAAFAAGPFNPAIAPAGVRQPYALHVGDLHARRNLITALSAILDLRRRADMPDLRGPASTTGPTYTTGPAYTGERQPDPTGPACTGERQPDPTGPAYTGERQPDPTGPAYTGERQSDPTGPAYTGERRPDLSGPASALRLVCAGIDRGLGAELRAAAAADPEALVLTGPVDEPALINLYRGATLLAYPSMYEGFGLPVLEAMQAGVPVVAANCASVPEVAGDAAVLVEPLDVRAWREAIGSVWQDAAMQARLREAGRARAAQFSWTRTARETLAVLQQAAAEARR